MNVQTEVSPLARKIPAVSFPLQAPHGHCPSVAIVTRTLGRPELLRRACASVLAQGFGGWEHIIVNDGGDAGAVESVVEGFAAAYGGRLRLIHNAVCLGRSAAANIGIRAASAGLITLLDDDDSWQPGFLQAMTAALAEQRARFPGIRAVCCRTSLVRERFKGNRIVTTSTRPFDRCIGEGVVSLDELLFASSFTTNAFLFEAQIWRELGGIDETLQASEDWDFFIRYALRHDIAVLPQTLANYHLRPGATGRLGNSVIAESGAAGLYRQMLRNSWLRRDLSEGRFGPGAYMNLRSHIEELRRNTGTLRSVFRLVRHCFGFRPIGARPAGDAKDAG